MTREEIEGAVRAAPIGDLARALLVPDGDGYGPAHDLPQTHCPFCQREPSVWLLYGPRMSLLGPFVAHCPSCNRWATLWSLQADVLADPVAIERLVGERFTDR